MNDPKFNKILIFINSLVPIVLLGWDAFYGKLGANPIEFFLRTTGILTLIFLLLTLLITPLRKLFGWNQLIKFRRMVGLYAFFYVCLHFVTYLVFDRSLNILGTIEDIYKRPFIAVGMFSFFLMIPLAITSTNAMIKRLGGKKWAKLHKLIYVIAIGGIIHYWMIVKSDIYYPVLFGLILAGLLGYRIYAASKKANPQPLSSKLKN